MRCTRCTVATIAIALGFLTTGTARAQRADSGTASLAAGPAGYWVPARASRALPLQRQIKLDITGAKLVDALQAIASKAGLKLGYTGEVPRSPVRVSLKADSLTVLGALTLVLEGTGFEPFVSRRGDAVLVGALPRVPVVAVGAIVGRVTDAKTQAALAGATVVVQGTSRSATTGTDGRYRLAEVAPGAYTVRARYIGYAPGAASVTVNPDQEATADFTLEKSAQRLDEVVTTGTVVPTEVKALPTPISMVTSDQIQALHIQRVDQLFRGDIPGMFAWDEGPADYVSTINVRGGSSLSANGGNGYIKTYIDGVEVAEPAFMATVDPNSIDHVEVIRGPQASTVYGSDALNGVLQIFTKTGDFGARPRLDAMFSGGVLQSKWVSNGAVDQQDYAASLSGGGQQFAYSLGGARIHTGQWVPEYSNTGNSFHGSVNGTSGPLTVDISGRYYQLTLGFPLEPFLEPYAGPPINLAPVNEDLHEQASTFAVTLTARARPNWTHVITLGYDRFMQEFDTRPRHTTPTDTLAELFNEESAKISVRYNNTLSLALGKFISAAITTGADYYQRRYLDLDVRAPSLIGSLPDNSFQSGDRSQFHNAGFFAQTQLGLGDRLFVTTGLRAEDNANFGQDFGLAWAPRIGVSHITTAGGATIKARASWGKAIRPPAQGISEGGRSSSTLTLPNPLLGPESQKGWDAGVELYYGSALSLQATYYHQTAEDLIDNVLVDLTANPLVYQYQNVGRVNNHGWEFEASTTPLRGLTLAATYSITASEVAALAPTYTGNLRVGDQLLGLPRYAAGATVTYRIGPARAALGMTHFGSWTNTDYIALFGSFFGGQPFRASGRDYWITYPGFEKYRLSLTFDISRQTTLFLDVKNLTNNYAYELYNFTAPKGRAILAGLHLGMGL